MILVTGWFGIVYTGANWLTAHRATRMRIHLDAELLIPLVPALTIIYMSIYLLFAAVPFVLRNRAEIKVLAATQTIAILLAGIAFLLIPARLAYATPPNSDLGRWKEIFRFADRLNLDYNLVPSLHVALSIVCVQLFATHANISGKILLHAWGFLIAASTVFTHQHHLLDVVTGYLLAFGTARLSLWIAHRKKHKQALNLPMAIPLEVTPRSD
jgi:membrane-associated phospholipid phosphatase